MLVHQKSNAFANFAGQLFAHAVLWYGYDVLGGSESHLRLFVEAKLFKLIVVEGRRGFVCVRVGSSPLSTLLFIRFDSFFLSCCSFMEESSQQLLSWFLFRCNLVICL